MTENKTSGASAEELMKAFGTDEERVAKRIGILDKVQMPVPNGKPTTIRFLWSKDGNGQPVAILKKTITVKGEKKDIYTSTVELYDVPGAKQLTYSASLSGSVLASLKERNLSVDDLPGKVGDITAQWYTAAPKSHRKGVCPECNGKGCKACTVTGSGQDAGVATGMATPTVYNFRLRDDLMQAVKGGAESQF